MSLYENLISALLENASSAVRNALMQAVSITTELQYQWLFLEAVTASASDSPAFKALKRLADGSDEGRELMGIYSEVRQTLHVSRH